MYKNYFRTAWRNLVKYRGLSLINVGGLVVGIASAIVLLSYVNFQTGYDRFNTNRENLYRVNLAFYKENKQVFQSAENYSALATAMKKELPEVVDVARLYNIGYKNNCVFTYDHRSFSETEFMYADSSFFRMFSFPFVKGDPQTALIQPFTVVISASMAKKIFGDKDPVGKTLKMDDDDRNAELCTITGVFKDVPDNSHLPFKVLISYTTLLTRRGGGPGRFAGWGRKDFYTYVQLHPGIDPKRIEAKIAAMVERNMPDEAGRHERSVMSLQPLSDIHLSTGLADEPSVTINPHTINFLIVIAFFIVTIGWINYINLSTAGSAHRAREVGVRKVLGSRKTDLIRQFLAESFSVNLISAILAMGVVLAIRPILERQFQLHIDLPGLLNSTIGLVFLAAVFVGALLAGFYPAFVLSSLKAVSVLKGKISAQPGGVTLRKSLLVFQFALSVFLIIGTVVVYRQVHFMLNKDLGMNITRVVVLDRPGKWDTTRANHSLYVERFKEMVLKSPAVEAVAMSDEVPGREIRFQNLYRLRDSKEQTPVPVDGIGVDENFLKTLQFRFLAGRNFSRQYKTDGGGLILTESAVRKFGFTDLREAIGKQLLSGDAPATILGVVGDVNQMSVEKKAQPIIFQYISWDAREFEYYLVKIRPGNAVQALQQIQASWNDAFRDNPFQFRFLDEDFNRQYQSVIRFLTFFAFFAAIAIVISCIGLFSLLAFMIQQRIKEIGVRKVLGATVKDIVVLLSRDFIRLLLLANVLAWPLGWLLMNNWLKEFANRVSLPFMLFLLSGLVAMVIALLTIGVQSVRAGRSNPVKTLKTE